MVPLERRLEYKMGDGQEPLCAFLGKDVPNVPFPRVNERKTHRAGDTKRKLTIVITTARKAGMFLLPVVVPGAGLWYSGTSVRYLGL